MRGSVPTYLLTYRAQVAEGPRLSPAMRRRRSRPVAPAVTTGGTAVASAVVVALATGTHGPNQSTMDDMTASVFDLLIYQSGWLLSIRWWAFELAGGYPQVQALRLVFRDISLSQVARRNGCLLPSDNDRLAKAMLGHVCFDAAIQAAARLLKAEWVVCGGYALSCLMRASAPHANYRYVEQLLSPVEGRVTESLWQLPHGNGVDKTFFWGDVDFFLINSLRDDEHLSARPPPRDGDPFPWQWSARKTRLAVRHAQTTLDACLATVAAYPHQFRSVPEPARPLRFAADRRGYWGGSLRNFTVGADLLGRPQSIQLILADEPQASALDVVGRFDMTQCAVWIEGSSPSQLSLGFPCPMWYDATRQHKGYMKGPKKEEPLSPALTPHFGRTAEAACSPEQVSRARVHGPDHVV